MWNDDPILGRYAIRGDMKHAFFSWSWDVTPEIEVTNISLNEGHKPAITAMSAARLKLRCITWSNPCLR